MILKNVSLLYGHDLKLIDSINVEIAESKFKKINSQLNRKNQNVVAVSYTHLTLPTNREV